MRHLILLLALALACTSTAQPTWRFPLAFEDGTGARDTIWLVYDTTATTGWDTPQVDYSLGEGRVDMDPSVFNVWVWNWDNDSTKTVAFPYTEFPYHNATVDAFNYQYPVTIRWDLSLGAEPWLPQEGWPIDFGMIYNQYFYYFNNCGDPPCGFFNMSLVDSVVVPQPDPNYLFPVDFTLSHMGNMSIWGKESKNRWSIWPNPANDFLHAAGYAGNITATIYTPLGSALQTTQLTPTDNTLRLDGLPDGTYLLILSNPNGNEFFKFVKMP